MEPRLPVICRMQIDFYLALVLRFFRASHKLTSQRLAIWFHRLTFYLSFDIPCNCRKLRQIFIFVKSMNVVQAGNKEWKNYGDFVNFQLK